MPLSQSTVYRHFRIDTDTDISGDVVKFGTDKVTWPEIGRAHV